MTSALSSQKSKYNTPVVLLDEENENSEISGNSGKLPALYSNLPTNVVTTRETIIGMTWAILNLPNWASVAFIWTWGVSCFIRNSSVLKFKLRDTYCDIAHGPSTEGHLKNIVALILRKGNIHKDRFTDDCVVGAWYHKEYLTCPTGFFAMMMMMRLFYLVEKISFSVENKRSKYFWRNIPLTEYTMYDDAYRDVTIFL